MRALFLPPILLALFSLTWAPSSARASDLEGEGDFGCTQLPGRCYVDERWTERTIPYVIRVPPADSAIDRETFIRLVTSAFDEWQRPRCTDLRLELRGVLDADAESEVENEVAIVTHGWADISDSDAAAITVLRAGRAYGGIQRARIYVNEEGHRFSDAATGCEDALDLGAVLTHEVGHFLGFAHPCELGPPDVMAEETPACPIASCDELLERTRPADERPTMWPAVEACELGPRSLTAGEVDGVCSRYPAGREGLHCARLPAQDVPYVSNEAFGCAAGGGVRTSRAPVTLGLFLLLYAIRPRSRRAAPIR